MRKRLVALSVIAVITTTCAGQALAQSQNPLSAIQQELSSIASQLNQFTTPPSAVSTGFLFAGSGDFGSLRRAASPDCATRHSLVPLH